MLLKPTNSVEADLIRAGVSESYTITPVASVEEPHAPTVNATGVNAFDFLMRHGQTAHRRTHLISPSDVSGWLSANTAKGNLGLRLQAFVEQCGASCSAPDNPVARRSIFIAVNRVFWAVTPASLQADCSTRTSAVMHPIQCIEDLFGTDCAR